MTPILPNPGGHLVRKLSKSAIKNISKLRLDNVVHGEITVKNVLKYQLY